MMYDIPMATQLLNVRRSHDTIYRTYALYIHPAFNYQSWLFATRNLKIHHTIQTIYSFQNKTYTKILSRTTSHCAIEKSHASVQIQFDYYIKEHHGSITVNRCLFNSAFSEFFYRRLMSVMIIEKFNLLKIIANQTCVNNQQNYCHIYQQ